MQLDQDLQGQLSKLRQTLRADFAIVSHIINDKYQVVIVDSEFDLVSNGDVFVTQDTYCNPVVEHDKPICYSKVSSIESMLLHPIYTAMQLEAYIGVPLHVAGKIFGTLNFSGFQPHEPNFSSDEIAQVLQLAQQVEQQLVKQNQAAQMQQQ